MFSITGRTIAAKIVACTLLCTIFFTQTAAETAAEEEKVFAPPETLRYVLKWGVAGLNLITAGTAEFALTEEESSDSLTIWNLRSLARSTGFVNWLHPVRDTIDVKLDAKEFLPLRLDKRLNEASYHDTRWAEYDHSTGRIRSSSGDTTVTGRVQDILSALYVIRMRSLEPGDQFTITVHDDAKIYPMSIRVLRKEMVNVPAGDFACVVIEPTLESTGLTKMKGRLLIWLSDDARHLPVMMRSKIPIGRIVAELTEAN